MSIRKLKLIVQEDECCITILEYLDDNITNIVRNGMAIQIDKISDKDMDEATKNMFISKGITRLPALLMADQKIIGASSIQKYFEDGPGRKRKTAPPTTDFDAEMGTNADLSTFWEKELFNGMDRKGRRVPRKDKDEQEDETADIERRLAEYRQNEPRHRKGGSGRERNIDREPRQTRQRVDRESSEEDNVGAASPSPPPRRGSTKPRMSGTGDAKGDDMDNRMMEAWLENNV